MILIYLIMKFEVTNSGSPEQTLSLNGILESGEAYVIAHNSANSTIISADLISGICSFNGDDAVGRKI